MVAKVNSGKSLQRILNYNENKVKAGVAECIHENMFGRDASALTFNNKLNGLNNFADRNMRATSKAVHISLNFHASDTLDNNRLIDIADSYMQRIGFGEQPYLVYRHQDAAHPHIHIVSTNIKNTGERIIMFNIGRNQSEKARLEIEREFGLTVAQGRREDKTAKVEKPAYGKTETKNAISFALRVALPYRYTSLAEFNAALKRFNVVADQGKEGSFMHSKRGLLYSMIDKNGKKVGVPIKASAFYNKPTLSFLEKQFKLNEALRLPHKARLKQCIDQALQKKNLSGFIKALNAERVFVVFRRNDQGLVYGLTFIDHKTKCVFNGSDLGKSYGAKTLMEQLPYSSPKVFDESQTDQPDLGIEKALDDLLTAKQYGTEYPGLKRRRKRKRRRSV